MAHKKKSAFAGTTANRAKTGSSDGHVNSGVRSSIRLVVIVVVVVLD